MELKRLVAQDFHSRDELEIFSATLVKVILNTLPRILLANNRKRLAGYIQYQKSNGGPGGKSISVAFRSEGRKTDHSAKANTMIYNQKFSVLNDVFASARKADYDIFYSRR